MLFCQDPTTQGVALNYLGELLVTNPEWQTLRVPAGGGVVYGFPYRNTGNLDFVLSIPTLGTTGWRLVLRTDWALHTVRAVLLQNDDGASGYPSLTQNAGYRWEISLAHGAITIGGAVTIVADDRAFLGSSAQITSDDMAMRTRRIFLPAYGGWDDTNNNELVRRYMNGLGLLDNALAYAFGMFAIPKDFVSTMIVTAVVIPPTASGNLYCQSTINYGACGEAYDAHSNSTGMAAIAVTNDLLNCLAPVALTNAVIDDIMTLDFTRDAMDALDTVNDDIYFCGWYIHYISDM